MSSLLLYSDGFQIEKNIHQTLSKAFVRFFRCGSAIPVTNGTHAIEIALRSLNIPRGSQIILPDISFIATASAVANCGFIPVYADVSARYFGITLDEIQRRINDDTRAVIVVHFGGYVNREILAIRDYCRQKRVYLIEDCAQAFGCRLDGRKVGTFGDVGTFSFQSSKLIQSGEGGLIITDNPEIANNCEAISNWGLRMQGSQRDLGLCCSNYRLSAIQCQWLARQLDQINEIIQAKLQDKIQFEFCCKVRNIPLAIPPQTESFFDIPFFMPIVSWKTLNTLEPRGEYPMRNSQLVQTILKSLFPDLVSIYLDMNRNRDSLSVSEQLLADYDFIHLNSDRATYPKILDAY